MPETQFTCDVTSINNLLYLFYSKIVVENSNRLKKLRSTNREDIKCDININLMLIKYKNLFPNISCYNLLK